MADQHVIQDSPLSKTQTDDVWTGRWHGHLVGVTDDLVLRIRGDKIDPDDALLVGPDAENPGRWIAATVPDGWIAVPQVREWYHYEDFVIYVKQEKSTPEDPVECAACAECEALANGNHVIDTGSANAGTVEVTCPISQANYWKLFGVTE